MSEDRCIICGEIIPEGRQVCPNCENDLVSLKVAKMDKDELKFEQIYPPKTEGKKPMKCNHFKEYPDCSFHYNGLCLREHIYECPPLMNMKNLSHGEMVQIAEEKKNKTPRYIDANKLIDLATHEGAYGYVDVHDIYNVPTADVVAVVRCRDCKWAEPYRTESGNVYFACQEFDARALSDDDYCSYGERKEKDNATLH